MTAFAAMLCLALLLGGCAGLDENRAGPPEIVQRTGLSQTEAGRRDYRLMLRDGDSIAVSEWRPDGTPRATILGVHGYGDHATSTFEGAARYWAGRGIHVVAYDQRGFGRNPSNRRWPGALRLIDDLAAVHALVEADAAGRKVYVLGHSMGGGVVVAALGGGRIAPDGAILLAPALWGGPHLNPFYRLLARSAAALMPEKRWTGDGIVRIQASDNIDALRKLGRDPLYVGAPSSREFSGLIALMDSAHASAGRIGTPVLMVYGDKDEVVPEEPVRDVFRRIPGEKRYERIESGWHLLLRDLEASKVHALIGDYVLSGRLIAP